MDASDSKSDYEVVFPVPGMTCATKLLKWTVGPGSIGLTYQLNNGLFPAMQVLVFFVAVFFQSYAPPLDQQPQRSVDFYLEFVLGLKIT